MRYHVPSEFKFGKRSQRSLKGVDERLAEICERALGYGVVDFAVLTGHRGEKKQTTAYETGRSKVQWPNSKHNQYPSMAVDLAPWPIDWKDSLAFARLAGLIQAAAAEYGLKIRWGGDWDSDGSSKDQSFMDTGHFELR